MASKQQAGPAQLADEAPPPYEQPYQPAGAVPLATTGQWLAKPTDCFNNLPLCCCALIFPALPLARTIARARLAPFVKTLVALIAVYLLLNVLSQVVDQWDKEHTSWVVQRDDRGRVVHVEYETDGPIPAWYWVAMTGTCLLSLAMCAVLVWTRRAVAAKYHVDEHACASGLCALCCAPCAIAQQAAHVDLAEYGEVDQDCTCEGEHRRAPGRADMPLR